MDGQKFSRHFVCMIVIMLLVGCGVPAASATPVPPAAPTPTPIPPTPTSIPPSPTPIPPTPAPTHPVQSSDFPTGKFIGRTGSTEVEFREDGSCLWYGVASNASWTVPCRYGVNGNLYAEMTFEYGSGSQVPVTYYWTYDGSKLKFRLYGEDLRDHRKSVMNGKPYTFVAELEASPHIDEVEFPTGRFVNEDGIRTFEFDEDGTWRFFDEDPEHPTRSGKYVSNGDLYTEMTHDDQDDLQIPATYIWTYDGQKLTFDLWGEEVNEERESIYNQQTYIRVED